jgi:hypothetical protein
MLGGATAGAIETPLFPQEDFNPMSRLATIPIGAVAGSGVGAVSGIFGTLLKIKNAEKGLSRLGQETIDLARGEERMASRTLGREAQDLKQTTQRYAKQQADGLAEMNLELENEIVDKATSNSEQIQQPIKNFLKQFKSDWGNRLDSLMSSVKKTVKPDNVVKWIDDTLDEIRTKGIDDTGEVTSKLEGIRERYLPQVNRETKFNYTTLADEPFEEVVKRADLSPMEVRNLVKEVNGSMSPGALKGSFRESDIGGAIFTKRVSDDFLSGIDGYKNIQNEYANFVDLATFAKNKLGVGRGPQGIQSANNFLESLGKKKIAPVYQDMLKRLEKETGQDIASSLQYKRAQQKANELLTEKNVREAQKMAQKRLDEIQKLQRANRDVYSEKSLKLREEKFQLTQALKDMKSFKAYTGLIAAGATQTLVSYLLIRSISGR